MGWLDGRVAIVTGAARGLGRSHAVLFASEGARVVVNDTDAVDDVVEEIRSFGGEAVANAEDVADWEGGRRMIAAAVESFGDLHVLVNNAAVLRDRAIVNMTEDEWDQVARVDLKGHFVPIRHAAEFWRDQSRAGVQVRAAVVNKSSTSGLFGNPGQANYGAAKAGIAALTVIAANELGRYGVRVNAVVPAARTRLTESVPGLGEMVAMPDDPLRFDEWDPANVSPVVAWLAGEECPANGCVLSCFGGEIAVMAGWSRRPGISRADRWTIEEIDRELPGVL